MKHSKKASKKYLFFFVLTIAICYGLGLAKGIFPNEWRYIFGKPTSSIQLLTSKSQLVPLSALIEFEKTTGIRIDYKIIESFHLFQTEVQKSDLLLAPLSWVSENSGDLPHAEELAELLDEDFRSLKLKPEKFLPLFWSVTPNQELQLWGFYTSKDTELHPETWHLISYLLQDADRLAGWVLRVGSPSTLQSMNARNDLSTELKPIHLRSFQLSKLKLSEKEKTDNQSP